MYGGWKNCAKSPYLHFSIVLALLISLFGGSDAPAWFDLTISILPNVLGFSLGGYAILLAFGDEKFRFIISGPDNDGTPSPFMKMNGAFIHFIVIQIFAILFALLSSAFGIKTGVLAWFGRSLLIYAISTALAAAMAILNTADWFDEHIARLKNNTEKEPKK